MSMLIKGLDMPKGCIDCPFMVSRDNDDCILQSDKANENFENWEQMKAGCPLVPVPKHGRCIDADKLKADNPRHMNADVPHVTEVTVEEIIDAAPTVIEADKDINVPCKEEGE